MNIIYMYNGRNKTLFHHQSGQSMVEFALILPLMVLMIAGIFDLGRAFYAYITITNAAREGARYGTLHPGNILGMKSAAVDEATGTVITLSPANITIGCPDFEAPVGCDRNHPLRVTVNYLYDDMILGFFFPSGIDMTRYVEMLVP